MGGGESRFNPFPKKKKKVAPKKENPKGNKEKGNQHFAKEGRGTHASGCLRGGKGVENNGKRTSTLWEGAGPQKEGKIKTLSLGEKKKKKVLEGCFGRGP